MPASRRALGAIRTGGRLSGRADVDRWYEEIHAPDILEIPGIAAAIRFSQFEGDGDGRYMNLYLIDGDPLTAFREIGQRSDGWVKRGRSPSPGNASKILLMSPYRSVNAMQYDLRVD